MQTTTLVVIEVWLSEEICGAYDHTANTPLNVPLSSRGVGKILNNTEQQYQIGTRGRISTQVPPHSRHRRSEQEIEKHHQNDVFHDEKAPIQPSVEDYPLSYQSA